MAASNAEHPPSQTSTIVGSPTQPTTTVAEEEKAAQAPIAQPPAVSASPYEGAGTKEDPYVVAALEGDENPYNWSYSYKWLQTGSVAIQTLCIAFASSAYSGGTRELYARFRVDTEIIILGISLYVVGFGFGPLIWAPLSEMYGRRPIFLSTYALFTLFHIGGACAQNIATIIVTRFFAGFFGAAPLVNSGGTIADCWASHERGVASALFALAPFLGPVLGPIVGGFSAQHSWRTMFWVMFAFGGATYILGVVLNVETYAPALLRAKAKKLTKASGGTTHYISKFDKLNTKTKSEIMKLNMTRPFILLFKEPIVLSLSIWTALVYGVLYLWFSAIPIVFQTGRGWSSGIGGLAFLGVGFGMCAATALAPINNKLYMRAIAKSSNGRAPPEARLPFAILGGVAMPIGLFWFAWTSQPSVHWIVPIMAGAPFGFGMILIFSGVINYLIDVYLLHAASALAANAVLRSILGAVFPLFSKQMYERLGNQWASTLVAFLSLACTPLPFLFYKYGPSIRAKSTFAMTFPSPAPAAPAAAPATSATPASAPAPETVLEKTPSVNSDTALEPEYGANAGGEREWEEEQAEKELARRAEGEKMV